MTEKKKPRETQATLMGNFRRYLGGDISCCQVLKKSPPLPSVYKATKARGDGRPLILRHDLETNTVEIISKELMVSQLVTWAGYLPLRARKYQFSETAMGSIVNTWMYTANDFDELPKPVGFKSDPDTVFKRLDFDVLPNVGHKGLTKNAPTFALMLENTTNADALCQRIGSVFDLHADRKQAVWCWGEKDGGKSMLSWLVGEISGGDFAALSPEDLGTSFWKATLLGKRLLFINEAASKFVRGHAFKSLTGDLDHNINEKGRKMTRHPLNIITFLFSNEPPKMKQDKALNERIIECKMESIPQDKLRGEYEVKRALLKELPYIVSYCVSLYNQIDRGGRIPVDMSGMQEIVDDYESEYLDFIHRYFIVDVSKTSTLSIDMPILYKKMAIEGLDYRGSKIRMKEVLLTRYGIKAQRPWCSGGKRIFIFRGLRLRRQEELPITVDSEPPPSVKLVRDRSDDGHDA